MVGMEEEEEEEEKEEEKELCCNLFIRQMASHTLLCSMHGT